MSDYCRISVLDVEDLDLVSFLCYVRDARIYQLSQTEDGNKYLKNAWRINQKAPERGRLRDKFGKGKRGTQ